MAYEHYFNHLGYKVAIPSHLHLIIKDFQRRTGLIADGIIGVKTKGQIAKHNKINYCPEVFEPIKPYINYTDTQIENLMQQDFKGLGHAFNRYAKDNDFDVLHSIAHGAIESGWGTSIIARNKKNLYGWTAYDSSAYESAKGFKSYEDCIKFWSYEFNRTYLEPSGRWFSGNNEYCVNINYASSPIAGVSKSFIVQQLRRKLER
jgi:beta-N-acetylglucosaminidase